MQTYLEHENGPHKSNVVMDSACAEEIAGSTTRRGSQNDVKQMFTEPELLHKLHLSTGQRKLLEEAAAYSGGGLQAVDETSFAHVGTDADPCEPTAGTGTDTDPFVFEVRSCCSRHCDGHEIHADVQHCTVLSCPGPSELSSHSSLALICMCFAVYHDDRRRWIISSPPQDIIVSRGAGLP